MLIEANDIEVNTMENTYWNNKGKFQAEYDRMTEELMPAMGACDIVAGELIRAVSRLGYDLYNNGMGNNTSGAVNFLLEKGAIDADTYDTIYEYTRGRLYRGNYNGDSLQVAIERAVDMTVEMILRNPQLLTMANTEDMFDYAETEQHFCEDCGEEVDSRYGGMLCQYCEESYYEEEDEENSDYVD